MKEGAGEERREKEGNRLGEKSYRNEDEGREDKRWKRRRKEKGLEKERKEAEND